MNAYYQKLLLELPAGLKRNILVVLTNHVGLENAITLGGLVTEMEDFHGAVKDLGRKVRLQIQELRGEGVLICSCAGSEIGRGYYLPANRKEFDQFLETEFLGKIRTMSITANVLRSSADKVLGRAYQEAIF